MSIHDDEQWPRLHQFWHGMWIPSPLFKQSDDGEVNLELYILYFKIHYVWEHAFHPGKNL